MSIFNFVLFEHLKIDVELKYSFLKLSTFVLIAFVCEMNLGGHYWFSSSSSHLNTENENHFTCYRGFTGPSFINFKTP